jgi:hypothetical protein
MLICRYIFSVLLVGVTAWFLCSTRKPWKGVIISHDILIAIDLQHV